MFITSVFALHKQSCSFQSNLIYEMQFEIRTYCFMTCYVLLQVIPHLAACCSGFAIIVDTESKRACGMLTDHMLCK